MKTKTDISYGVIPVRNHGGQLEVFLIHQFSHIKRHAYWTFPKGHPEGNETPQETAKRELQEETGLAVDTFLSERLFKNEYSFKWEGVLVKKTAAFFLAIVKAGEVAMQEAEVRDAKWVPLDQVLEQLDYEASKKMFRKVLESGLLEKHLNFI